MDNVTVCGKKGVLHFIRFPTAEMSNFLDLAKKKGMAKLVTTVCATGGGAFKFEDAFRKVSQQLRMKLLPDENTV
jgi:type II pantothenate kinase